MNKSCGDFVQIRNDTDNLSTVMDASGFIGLCVFLSYMKEHDEKSYCNILDKLDPTGNMKNSMDDIWKGWRKRMVNDGIWILEEEFIDSDKYSCSHCGHMLLVKSTEDISKIKECPKCHSKMELLTSHLKKRLEEQEAKADAGKLRLTLVPRRIIFEIAKVREYGVKKYIDPDNWKKVGDERYRDAAFRHFMAYLDDPYGVDEESGLPHLSHLACNIAFLCEGLPSDVPYSEDDITCENCIYEDYSIHEYPCNDCCDITKAAYKHYKPKEAKDSE